MKRHSSLITCIFIFVTIAFVPVVSFSQVNPNATEKTKILYSNLKILQNSSQFLFGQEFFNSFRYSSGSAHGEKDFSDSKSVTTSHPALLGSDFHYYIDKDATERGYHTEAVKWAYQQGYAITFDWHISGRNSPTYEYNLTNKDLVNNILGGNINGDSVWLMQQFDKVIDIINNDLVVDGERIPIVFRPWHEMNGGWFWWGKQATTSENYKKLYQLTVNYFKERTTSVMFCWSPNTPTEMIYYPGDAYVDVLGVDSYEISASTLRSDLALIVDHAQAHNKVAVLSETGNRTSNGDNAAAYWQSTVLPAILNDPAGKAKKIAWVLTWINSSWSYPYVPHGVSSAVAKSAFLDFKETSNVIFGDEIPNQSMYAPMDEPVAAEPESKKKDDLIIFPVPSKDKLNIRLKNFSFPVNVILYNAQGKALSEFTVNKTEISLDWNRSQSTGIYFIKASDANRSLTQKVIIE